MKKKLSLFTLFLVMPFVIFGAIQIWWYSQAPHATSVNDTDIMLVERPVPHTNLWFNMAQLRSYTSTGITNLTVSNAYITNIYVITGAVDNITVTNGITNLSLTANTVLKADANKRISSILPNASGVLTNDGAGNVGFFPVTSLGVPNPWTNNTDFTWLSGFTMATNGAPQTAPFSIWTNASFFVGPDVFQDIAQDPTTVHFPYAVLLTDSNGPNALQFSMNVYDSLAGSAFSKWFSTVSPSQSSATYENSIHNDKLSWRMQTVSEFDFSTNTVSIFHIDNEGLTTANGYVDKSGNVGDLVAYGASGRLVSTNVLGLLTNVAVGSQVLTNDGTYVHLVGTVTNVSSPWELANDGELLIGTNVFLGGLAPGFHVFGAVSMTDSNQPAFQFFDMVVTDDVLRKNYGIISGASTGSSASWSLFSGTDGASSNSLALASQTGHAPLTWQVDSTNRALLSYDGHFTGLGYLRWTNHWAGPTNNIDLSAGDSQDYVTTTSLSVTGFVNKPTVTDVGVVLSISNSTASDVTLYLPAGVITDDGQSSYVVSNKMMRVTSIRYNSWGYTQAVSRMFPGAGTSGTVTSVGAAGPDGFTWSAPVTGSGTLTATTPGLVLTNGESQQIYLSNTVHFAATNFVVKNFTTSTNLTFGPDFSLAEQLISTNTAFTFQAPMGVDSTGKAAQWTLTHVTNTTAAAVLITSPANCHTVGTPYVTNLTDVWFNCYGGVFTNAFYIPIF